MNVMTPYSYASLSVTEEQGRQSVYENLFNVIKKWESKE